MHSRRCGGCVNKITVLMMIGLGAVTAKTLVSFIKTPAYLFGKGDRN